MKTSLVKLSLCQNAIFIPQKTVLGESQKKINATTGTLLANCKKLGYTFSENLLHAINGLNPIEKIQLLDVLKEVTGVKKNWTPLVKQWDIPTGESIVDHIKTFWATIFPNQDGTRLACGHLIPTHTFPLERYNGCPFCGIPFEQGELVLEETKNKLKVLNLWTEEDLEKYFRSLLLSPVALDATQADNVKILLQEIDLPADLDISIKETKMLVIDGLVGFGNTEQAGQFFKTPNDILRYLWFKHTGFLQIIEPKTIKNRMAKNGRNWRTQTDESQVVLIKSAKDLKLKFSRSEARMYASWLNNLEMPIAKQCEIMHPKRGIWVRVIRALRLAEYSKRKGYGNLRKLLDTFYQENYSVWQGRVNHFKLKTDAANTFRLLKQRPGLFARSLFSTMLWFGKDETIAHFKEVIHEVPARLVFTLNMYADIYFDSNAQRSVKPLGGVSKKIPVNKLLQLYTTEQLDGMKKAVRELSLYLMESNFSKQANENQTIYIDKDLYKIPIAIGDRSEQLQDLPHALMGTRFPVAGDTIRLFMQWGEGLPAQHLDMDLSCQVAYESRMDFCSYSKLVVSGCKHSGDIQQIPNKVGTAEYIDVDVDALTKLGAKYVSFTCNAFTNGSLSPNLVVGWMDSQHPMKVSKAGVAYDPTAVQHQVRVTKGLVKGMVFGILDVAAREIIWLEMGFSGQVVQNLDSKNVEALLKKLEAKLKIGDLLELKARCQGLEVVADPSEADEAYDLKWALNAAEVSALFLS
ncbi:MAG: hypothetical protein AAF573_15450 [Bacteroidota bacterium]